MLLLDQRILDDGTFEGVTLEVHAAALTLRVGRGPAFSLPHAFLDGVMKRYGKPLSPGTELDGPALDIGEGRVARMLRHRGRYDVIAKDYFVLTTPGAEPQAALATTVTAALLHLCTAAPTR